MANVITACGDPDGTTGNANGIKFDSVMDNPKIVAHSYASASTYTAKVIVERDIASPVEKRVTITG